ncbi:MAG: GTP cyclohydrolase FolE2 [Burkholderiales bacterium]|nr:GTP cyclohydrolase FolE2 [Burkholderiales bacterium]
MNAKEVKHSTHVVAMMPDVQSEHDTRRLPIDRVGVKRLRYPIHFVDRDGAAQATVAACSAYIMLSAQQKGTHMSRLVTLFEEMSEKSAKKPLKIGALRDWSALLLKRLGATAGELHLEFDFFARKKAPVSSIESTMNYLVRLSGEVKDGRYGERVEVDIPVTSLCPCSKRISDYGAHNQRSVVTLGVMLEEPMSDEPLFVMDLIRVAEEEASSELFAILKRADEKYVTEYAHDHPNFVEDMVRGIAQRLAADKRLASFSVEAENFESIHNHSAYAQILIQNDSSR